MPVTHADPAHAHRPRLNPWLVAVIALAAALVALGVWVVVDHTRSSSTEGLPSRHVAWILEHRIAAFNHADVWATMDFYTEDAIMEEEDTGYTMTGTEQIADRLRDLMDDGLLIKAVGAPIQVGRFVSEAVSFYDSGGTSRGEGVLVFELDKNGNNIAHQWFTGEVR